MLIHTDCITVTGKTIGENHEAVAFPEGNKIVYPVSNPITPTGGVVGLRGNQKDRRHQGANNRCHFIFHHLTILKRATTANCYFEKEYFDNRHFDSQ